MAQLSNICKNNFLSCILHRNGRLRFRSVSSSGKKEEAAGTACDKSQQAVYRKVPDFSKPQQNDDNWVSYGFDSRDRGTDRFKMHTAFFALVTLLLFGGSFVYMYTPDRGRYDWARREAFIRLHEREQLGLEPIDKNFIDPSKIVLPPDEELSEEDIVI